MTSVNIGSSTGRGRAITNTDVYNVESVDIGLPSDFEHLFADEEVDAKYKKLEDHQAQAAQAQERRVSDDDTSSSDDEEGESSEGSGGTPKSRRRRRADGSPRPAAGFLGGSRRSSSTGLGSRASSPGSEGGSFKDKKDEKKKKKKRKKKGKKADGPEVPILPPPPPSRWRVFKRPAEVPRWKRLLNQPAELRELQVQSMTHEATWLAVIHPCPAWKVKKKLVMELKLKDSKDVRLVFLGQLLKDEDVVPEECYSATSFNFLRWLDKESLEAYLGKLREEEEAAAKEAERLIESLRQRQSKKASSRKLLIDDDLLSGLESDDDEAADAASRASDAASATDAAPAVESTAPLSPPTSPASRQTEHVLPPIIHIGSTRNIHKGIISPSNARKSVKARKMGLMVNDSFDLTWELSKIMCEQYAALLIDKGFADKGAFAYVREAELTGPGLWIPRKAAIRILGLADVYKRQFEIEKQAIKTDLDELRMNPTSQYTVDGIHFFDTQADMVAWLEAEKKRKKSIRGREMSVKRDHSVEVQDLYASIAARMRQEEEREEGKLLQRGFGQGNFCCIKHKNICIKQVEDVVEREAVNYSNDFSLLLGAANKAHSDYVPGDMYVEVLVDLFKKHGFPFRQKLIDEVLDGACKDDNRTCYDEDVVRDSAVNLLKLRKRRELLDLRD